MKTDAEIKQDVLDELAWQPNVDETEIGVIVENGVVTLSGVLNNYSKKVAAEKAVKSVEGVKALAGDIEVKYGNDFKKTDKEIAKAVVEALEWNSSVPEKNLTIKVEDGWVYLSGEVKWGYQREAAKRAVENLLGVRSVINSITIKQDVKPFEVKDRIKKAFERSAELDAKNITVLTDGHTVTLRGKVHSLKEKEDAETAAYRAPGVYYVLNELKVQYYTEYA
ncbi:Osmotically-inducible protein OsmY, contains BON domain [Maribacter orientalis]|uniref:Osmotically-inducible protein OsmY, contains BON domain n=1 Tax=Maribacter orientalis TaxID=228957 RepID=A0A1H7RQ75_9FLAO|nr:BON domain-containing protein [Maribacter orientalis]SEL62169.1 Osmotically-inducible protein OsmY, contains BON domain [Maribacter orientalis]|tara:strand:+ start:7011 stop:7679 length:669 start_codon:yes stop_codon:yes gene_type:complete